MTMQSTSGAADEMIVETRNGAGQPILATVRASAWGTFADCQLRWYYGAIEGLRLPSRGPTVVGSGFHVGAAVYDQAVLDNRAANISEATEAARAYIASPVTPDGEPQEVVYDDDDGVKTKGEAIDIAVKLTDKYCRTIAPTQQYAGVELKCTALDVTTENGVVRLTGTTDRIRRTSKGEWGVGDFKTGKTAVTDITTAPRAVTKGHGLQLGAYTLMSEQATGKPLGAAAIVGLQTNSKAHIAVSEVENPKLALVGTADKPGMIEIFADVAKRGVFAPNPKSTLCSEKWCAAYSRCIYHA